MISHVSGPKKVLNGEELRVRRVNSRVNRVLPERSEPAERAELVGLEERDQRALALFSLNESPCLERFSVFMNLVKVQDVRESPRSRFDSLDELLALSLSDGAAGRALAGRDDAARESLWIFPLFCIL